MAIPVGCTERREALRGWLAIGRVKLVTTNRSPHAARYWLASLSIKSLTAGRATGNETAFSQ